MKGACLYGNIYNDFAGNLYTFTKCRYIFPKQTITASIHRFDDWRIHRADYSRYFLFYWRLGRFRNRDSRFCYFFRFGNLLYHHCDYSQHERFKKPTLKENHTDQTVRFPCPISSSSKHLNCVFSFDGAI